MRPAWVTQYLQIPFTERGRTRAGLDCYGLARLVFQEQCRIELPSYAEEYATTLDMQEIAALYRRDIAKDWRDIPPADVRLFDGLIFRIMGQPTHFALVLDPPYMLHTMRGTWSHVERWDGMLWQKRLLGMVRWHGAQLHE